MPSDSSHPIDASNHDTSRCHTSERHNARLGLVLFFLYLLLYVGFVGISALAPSWMEWRPGGGLNLALLYGFGLILAALVLAFVYGLLAKSPDQSLATPHLPESK